MDLDCAFGQEQGVGDLPVGPAPGDEGEYLALAAGEAGESVRRRRRRGREQRHEAFDQPPGGARRQHGIPGGDRADGGDEVRSGDVLEQEAAGARAQAGVDVVVEVERGQDEDPGAGKFRRDLAGRGDPVGAWHADVHEDNVRAQRPRHGDRGGAVARFADDLDVGLGVEDHLEPGPDQRLVIDDKDADHVASIRGRRAETVQPCGERGPLDTSPPKAMTRSRIPSRPCPEGGGGIAAVPCPSSSARTRISDGAYWTRTVARASRPACFIVFVSASWMTRYTQSRTAALVTEESPAVS